MKPIDWNAVRAAVDVLAQRAPSPALSFGSAFASSRPSPTPAPLAVPRPVPVSAPALPEQPLDEFREFKWD